MTPRTMGQGRTMFSDDGDILLFLRKMSSWRRFYIRELAEEF